MELACMIDAASACLRIELISASKSSCLGPADALGASLYLPLIIISSHLIAAKVLGLSVAGWLA
jgi:hypothetical protein